MPVQTPKIDKRTYSDIVEQTKGLLVEKHAVWQPREDGQRDAGEALVGIFAHMVEQIIERINEAPERNLLAFLEMIGVRQLPPRPARVPLTFYLAAGVQEEAVTVPAGTQAAPATDPSLVFETDDDLTVHRAQLKALFVHDPTNDKYADHSSKLSMETPASFSAFEGDTPVEHSLYLACDPYFGLPEEKTVTLTVEPDNTKWKSLDWSYGKDEEIPQSAPTLPNCGDTSCLLNFSPLAAPIVRKVDGVEAAWLRARPPSSEPPKAESELPKEIKSIRAEIELKERELPVAKLTAFADTLRLDLSKAFYPFGEKPRRGSTFYIAVPLAFETGENIITLRFPQQSSTENSQSSSGGNSRNIVWEAWSNEEWKTIINCNDCKDLSGEFSLTLPDPMTRNVVNGESGYWLRARITEGDYGKEAKYEFNSEGGIPSYTPATLAPPLVETLTVRYSYTKSDLPVTCKTRNNFKFLTPSTDESFEPFEQSKKQPPALYLGFDSPLPNRAISLYWNVAPETDEQTTGDGELDAVKPRLKWQYAVAGEPGWKDLYLMGDETQNFTRRGLITFIGPSDLQKRHEFDQELYWLRIVHTDQTDQTDQSAVMPEVIRVLTNTVWASQAATVLDEILGSGTGEANQLLSTTRAPVLDRPQIEVCELELPNTADLNTIRQEEGSDAVRRMPAGEIWVRWHEVPDFYNSNERSRHYSFDHASGQVRFGDGRYGMAPPRMRNSIRATRYRTGGGKQGNCPAHTITQLKTTIPFVDRVKNHEAAEGGANEEPPAGVKERGPKQLRHRDRAVALADYEDLAYEASPAVARARAIDEEKGKVTVVIVAQREERKPEPSFALCEDVAAFIRQRSAPAARIGVVAPQWQEVTVTVTVVPVSTQAANTVAAAVRTALDRFLHPITGGLDRRGWTFGRQPHQSDLYALIEAVEGVDHVSELEPLETKQELSKQSMIYSGDHRVTVEGKQ